MSRFNGKSGRITTQNKAGGKGYTISYQEELLRLVLASFFSDNYYSTHTEQLERMKELVEKLAKEDREFLLGLAYVARNNYYMRTTSHIILGEITKNLSGEDADIKNLLSDTLIRTDDMTEFLSYLLEGKTNKKQRRGLTHQIRKGINKAFSNFDEYQLSKYNKKTTINLKDVVRLGHIGTSLAKKVLEDDLQTAYTWESELSKYPKDDHTNRVKVWNNLLFEHKLGYMAALRNIRNILIDASNVSEKEGREVVEMLVNYLVNQKAVENSKQLIFRFYSAYREVEKLESIKYKNIVLEALKVASSYSIKNLHIGGKIASFSDVSGSMEYRLSNRSSLEVVDIGLLFGGLVSSISEKNYSGIFGNIAELKVKSNKDLNPFWLRETYREGEVGYSTYGYKAIKLLKDEEKVVDKIFLFTDTNLYSSSKERDSKSKTAIDLELSNYNKFLRSKGITEDVKLYIFNLSSSSDVDISKNNNVVTITGWSDKIFEYLDLVEGETKSQVGDIRKIGMKYSK